MLSIEAMALGLLEGERKKKQKEKAIMEKPRRHKSSNRATGKGRADREIPHRTGKGRADLSAGKQYTEPGIGAPRGCHNRRTPH